VGHISGSGHEYRSLQRRLDRNVTGAPESPAFTRILKLLYSPEEAELATHLPSRPTPLDVLARRLGLHPEQLCETLTGMAQRGLVLDFERGGRHYFMLPPVVIGLYEFTFMRTRDDLPMAELARLFEEYMRKDDRFVRSVFRGKTQVGRSLVREEALPEGDHTEILDWERASRIVSSARAVGVSLCACRHEASHLGKACDRPQETCLTLGYMAEALIRNGFARPITNAEAMRIIGECKELGLAQTADNVQSRVTYICNCCGCCCGMMQSIKGFGLRHAIVTSNWITEVDLSRCKGCGKCAEACPVEAVHIAEEAGANGKRRWAVRDEGLCLGCGVCYSVCKQGAIRMKPRPKRVFTPEKAFDRVVSMAIERGKLGDLIFDDAGRLSHRAFGRIVRVLEKSPPFKAAMAVKPLRSAFFNGIVKGAKKGPG
jgi:ferredoxin